MAAMIRYKYLQIFFTFILLEFCSCYRLLLIEQDELLRYKPTPTDVKETWQLILQNPFPGSINFKESENDQFQILFNVTGDGDAVSYNLTKDLHSLRVHLSSQPAFAKTDSVDIEALHFLFIYAIGAACMVGLSTAGGLFFLICWGNTRRRGNLHGVNTRARESDATKMPLLVSEPPTPHVNKHQFSDNAVPDGAIATLPRHSDSSGHKRWIHPGSGNYMHGEEEDFVASTLPLRGASSIRPTGILKRPSGSCSAGSAGGSSSLDRASFHSGGIGVALGGSTTGSVGGGSSVVGPSSRCSDSNTDLDSNDSRKLGSVASSSSSRPRHIAREFLDESTLSGRTGARRAVSQAAPATTIGPISTGPPVITTGGTVCSTVPSGGGTAQLTIAANVGVSNVVASLAICGKESPSPLPEPPQFEPGFMYRGGMSSAQGSDETSGIISDSDVSSLERQQQSQSSTSSSNNKLSSSIGGTSTSTIGGERYISLDSNDERYIALNVPVSTPTADTIPTSSTASASSVIETPAIDMTIPRRGSAGGGVVTSSGPSTPTLRPMVGSYTSSSTLSSASSVQTVLAADDMAILGTNGGTSSLGRTFRPGISPVPPKRSVSLKGSTSFGEGGWEQIASGLDDDDDDQPLPPPPSSATSPRSALKGSRPPGPPINKQLRFTTLTLLALCCLCTTGAFALVNNANNKPKVVTTIYLPKKLYRTNKELSSILLYLNTSSQTKVNLGDIPRSRLMIYDVVNANHYVSRSMCETRYSCSHTCDPGLGYKCICERGYELMDNTRCKDTNECQRENHPCTGNRKKCSNLPGHFACDCPLDAKGLVCGDCGDLCKPGFYIWQNCTENQPRVCKACSICPRGSYVTHACRANGDTECKGCNPLCTSDQYEFMPCTRTTNRICRSRRTLPGINLPFKDNIWHEDLLKVNDASTIYFTKTPANRTIFLHRGSGYKIKLQFQRKLNVIPILEPEDHSRANDNQYYKSQDPLNKTLRQMCPYPLTKYYNLVMRTHTDVMSLAAMDHNLPGYKPTLRPCRTYKLWGPVPEVVKNGVPCVQPGRLPGLFGRENNDLLAKYQGEYVEKYGHCSLKSRECHNCVNSCVKHMNKTPACRPSAEPGDNGLSPRLQKCFNCCARDNCTAMCQQYFKPTCKPKLCMKGALLEFELQPTWSETHDGRFFCHVRLRQHEPVYHVNFWLYRGEDILKRQPFVALLHPSSEEIKPLIQKKYHFLVANYLTGLTEVPVVVGGDAISQTGYRWNDQGTPLASDLGSSRGRSASIPASGGIPVWTRTPMALNSASWRRLSCSDAEKSLNDLFREQGIDPLVPITQIKVSHSEKYQYQIQEDGIEPMVNFSIPRSSSVLASLFKPTYVHRGDYLRADLIYDRTPGPGGYRWVIRVSGAVAAKPGLFQIKLFQVANPVGKPLYDYEVGVYQERRFQLEFIMHAPDEEPTYTKAFKVLILDTKGSMELHVERPQQDSKKLETVRRFQASTVPRPDVFPSVSIEAASNEDELKLLGIPDQLWWGVLGAILILCFLLLVGHLTEPTEMILGRKANSKPTEPPSEPSCKHRLMFMIYIVFKSAYSFSVTLTALLIVARVLTDLPDDQPSSYENFFSNITVHERLLLDQMNRHLNAELTRQRMWVEKKKDNCEKELNKTYKLLEKMLATVSKSSAWRRNQVHVSAAVLERAKAQVRNLSRALQKGREEFEQSAMDAVIQLMSDIKSTHENLLNNKWLKGARKIHEMVRAQRSNRPGMRIQPFEQWAKIDVTLSRQVPSLVLSSDLPLPNASELTLGDLHLPPYGEYKEPALELDRNTWYVRDETVTRGGISGDLGGDMSSRNRNNKGGMNDDGNSPPRPPVQITWHHLLGVALTLDALLLLYRVLHTLDSAQQILNGATIIVDCTRSALTRNRKGEVIQPDWCIKLKRTIITTMESDFVPLTVAAAFAYLFVFLLGSYSHELISEQTLDSIGFYDNLVLPVHARYRLVNTHIATQAERSNQVELAHFERSANARFEQYQFILAEWRDWLIRLERTQCEQLLIYKERSTNIPKHCSKFAVNEKIINALKLEFEGCSLQKVQPRLFDKYNEKLYFDSIVANSRPFIVAVRDWMSGLTFVVFVFLSAIVLWNLFGATFWFYLRRWNLIHQKELYEVDLKGSL